jgi:magnesium chelatase subunit D
LISYPFTAVVGMQDMRLALVLNAISPAIGGVLVRGEKGTAKSTAVRALAAVLPPVAVVAGCRFSCDPSDPDAQCPDGPHPPDGPIQMRPAHLVELPVGSSEDRLTGSLDIERALTQGVKSFEPGLLAAAHRGVLYVDEVNLLHDHLVDLLLDAAALGTSYVERDGVSVRHAARFLLVGTMNPEEGELRPQLLDRFGLTVEVSAPADPVLRAEVVRRRLAFDLDAVAFLRRFAEDEQKLAESIVAARAVVDSIELPDDALHQIASVCSAFGVDGLRADIVTARAAVAHAAWHGRTRVDAEDIRAAARLALPHRRRRNPFDAPDLDEQQLDDALSAGAGASADASAGGGPADRADDEPDPDPDPDGPGDAPGDDPSPAEQPSEQPANSGPEQSTGNGQSPADRAAAPSGTFRTRRLEVPGLGAGAAGRRSRAQTDHGQVIRAIRPVDQARSVHLTATMIAAAPYQAERGRGDAHGLVLHRDDLREAQREGREGNLVLFVVDASGSMAARQRMSAVKGAVLSLLLDAYQRRDKVGLICFRGSAAELVLPPTSSVDAAASRLTALPTGGRTPLVAGLLSAHHTLAVERLRDPKRRPLLVVVTDGRHTWGGDPTRAAHLLARERVTSVVLDCESGPVRLGLAAALAQSLGGTCLRIEDLAAGAITDTVRTFRQVA